RVLPGLVADFAQRVALQGVKTCQRVAVLQFGGQQIGNKLDLAKEADRLANQSGQKNDRALGRRLTTYTGVPKAQRKTVRRTTISFGGIRNRPVSEKKVETPAVGARDHGHGLGDPGQRGFHSPSLAVGADVEATVFSLRRFQYLGSHNALRAQAYLLLRHS